MRNKITIAEITTEVDEVPLSVGQIWMHKTPNDVDEYYIVANYENTDDVCLVCLNDGLVWNSPTSKNDRTGVFLAQEEDFTLITNKTLTLEIL
jgi:hypothetical protein